MKVSDILFFISALFYWIAIKIVIKIIIPHFAKEVNGKYKFYGLEII
jgi:hypothetical protein